MVLKRTVGFNSKPLEYICKPFHIIFPPWKDSMSNNRAAKSPWFCRKFPENKPIFPCSDEPFENIPDYGNWFPECWLLDYFISQIVGQNFPNCKIHMLAAQILKALYTFGNCQRPVFSLGVSHQKHTITSLWTFWLNWSSKLRENYERKTPLLDEFACFQIEIKDF